MSYLDGRKLKLRNETAYVLSKMSMTMYLIHSVIINAFMGLRNAYEGIAGGTSLSCNRFITSIDLLGVCIIGTLLYYLVLNRILYVIKNKFLWGEKIIDVA